MKKYLFFAILCVMISVASAEIIRGIDIDFVIIGNAGNAGDTRTEANPSGAGAVDYEFQIGKYEVTNAQWNDFITTAGAPMGNANGYNQGSSFTDVQQPVNNTSWYEALQFCNYLTSGDKSQGVYQWSGNNANPGNFLGINRNAAEATYSTVYFLPTEDEWYKAAYYTSNSYSTYANGTDTKPTAGVDTNYDQVFGSPWNVGTGIMEQNGTYDMMGNVWEWNETIIGPVNDVGMRGGSYYSIKNFDLSSSTGGSGGPTNEVYSLGFRVASNVPEPGTLLLLAFGGFLIRRKK